jgi:hypothetical protein
MNSHTTTWMHASVIAATFEGNVNVYANRKYIFIF